MKNLLRPVLLVICLSILTVAQKPPKVSHREIPEVDAIIQEAIAQKWIPGAVVLVGHEGKIVFRKAYGQRALEPAAEPMTVDTVFDAASLTKAVATAPSVLRLLEQGKFRLNDSFAKFVPEFARNGKDDVTIRQMLTHYSGLRPDVDLDTPWTGKPEALRRGYDEKLAAPPGSRFIYSDINYFLLGDLVERLSGKPLEQFAADEIFTPLGMKNTRFLPPAEWLTRVAPTQYDENNQMLRGMVHDPTSRRMGGVAGHAGMFTTADDLALFAQAMLEGKVLSPLAVEKMTTPQQPVTATSLRGFGWDIDTGFSSNRGELLPVGSYGHTGFTGTSLWIDPYTETYIIIMTNAVHPRGDVQGAPKINLRTRVSNAVAAALKLDAKGRDERAFRGITGYNETLVGFRRMFNRNGVVLNGIDVLQLRNFDPLRATDPGKPRKIGLVTNHTGIDRNGKRTIDVLAEATGIKLMAIFAPEHGVLGQLDTEQIGHAKDAKTGVQVYSIYGTGDAARRPSQDVLKTLDAVVYDIQDVGVRFYTYETTLGYLLEECAKAGCEVVVLDRPNPITGTYVQGVPSDPGRQAFINYHPVPVRHGMTVGELARFYNKERKIDAKLTVVEMQGWQRGDWFDATNQLWVNLSPNMRSLNQATLYSGVGLIEGTNVSVGRGTDTPFEVVGAPWIKAMEFADYLNRRLIPGVRFVPVHFTPTTSKHEKQLVGGVNIIVTDRQLLDGPELGLELASALIKLYPQDFKTDRLDLLMVHKQSADALLAGEDPRRIADGWRESLEAFQALRQKYLIYK